ncbi:hypothetical protein [Gemmata sp.]|uniref:hypothetical protein n=1 Tax=Gemmata sp. TaxID=1914242 RepID=UPI003F7233D7
MFTSVLRELSGPYPLLPFLQEPWFLREPLARHLLTAWEQTSRRVLRDNCVEELHAVRDDYHAVLLGHVRIIEGYLTLMGRFGGDPHGDVLRHLAVNLDSLRRHYDSLFPQWQTLDDLRAVLADQINSAAWQRPTPVYLPRFEA